jgi:two-component system, LuxR family, response regulator FixJ
VIGSTITSVFFVGVATPGKAQLDPSLRRAGVSLAYFDVPAACREALDTTVCHLLVINIDGHAAEGLRLLVESSQRRPQIPALALVDHGDISTAVRAIRAGADNCIEKPVAAVRLRSEILSLLAQSMTGPSHSTLALTPMEKTVLERILEGKTSSETARILHRSPRTIEVHRSHIMRKLGVSGMVDLVRVASEIGLFDAAGR